MRILIKFRKAAEIEYTQYQLQSLVYNLVRTTGFFTIHSLPRSQPRFFSFSQIFSSGGSLVLVIASPIGELIKEMKRKLEETSALRIGNFLLEIQRVSFVKIPFSLPVVLKTETPIVVRVPKYRFKEYGLQLDKDYPYFYWRPLEDREVPLEPFVRQLEARIWKNYKLFTGSEVEEKPIFSRFVFRKSIDLPYFKNGRKISRPGTLWELEIGTGIKKELISFILDTGLGELASQGYGFVNIKN